MSELPVSASAPAAPVSDRCDVGQPAAVGDVNMSLELDLLAELRGALTEHDITSQMRDDVGALAVSTQTPGVYLWVFVGFSTRYFSWARGNHQHPVWDIPGAARRIATHLQGLHLLAGGES